MATTTAPLSSKGSRAGDGNGNGRRRLGETVWPLSFTLAAVLVFVLYQWVLPQAPDGVATFFQDWLPMSTVNQCVIWATMAVGLNIVVGYAGLLDLGYVAFWAIGGYVAG
jgi:branched-chain amino acid transport system permease protein